MSRYFCGIDCGASATKIVLINGNNDVIAHAVWHSGIDFNRTAGDCFTQALKQVQASRQDVATVATGYGRENVEFCDDTKTEIACHGKAAYFHHPQKITVVDIGSQDNKIIWIDSSGKRTKFKMNRKCAAGTGAFLKEISAQLQVPLGEMNDLAGKSTGEITLGSYCTVFTKTEILALIRRKEKLEDIAKAVYDSIVKRICAMATLEGDLVMTGGVVAHNRVLVHLFEKKLNKPIFVPPLPQLAGAFGAALFAVDL